MAYQVRTELAAPRGPGRARCGPAGGHQLGGLRRLEEDPAKRGIDVYFLLEPSD